jgi:hypothetical protein
LGHTSPAAPYQGQSFIIMTRSDGSGNVEKGRVGEEGTRGIRKGRECKGDVSPTVP